MTQAIIRPLANANETMIGNYVGTYVFSLFNLWATYFNYEGNRALADAIFGSYNPYISKFIHFMLKH